MCSNQETSKYAFKCIHTLFATNSFAYHLRISILSICSILTGIITSFNLFAMDSMCNMQDPWVWTPVFFNRKFHQKTFEVQWLNSIKVSIRKKWWPKIKRTILVACHGGVKICSTGTFRICIYPSWLISSLKFCKLYSHNYFLLVRESNLQMEGTMKVF